jgi:hypothetical protein
VFSHLFDASDDGQKGRKITPGLRERRKNQKSQEFYHQTIVGKKYEYICTRKKKGNK